MIRNRIIRYGITAAFWFYCQLSFSIIFSDLIREWLMCRMIASWTASSFSLKSASIMARCCSRLSTRFWSSFNAGVDGETHLLDHHRLVQVDQDLVPGDIDQIGMKRGIDLKFIIIRTGGRLFKLLQIF